jgi:hypothetical protein
MPARGDVNDGGNRALVAASSRRFVDLAATVAN